MLLYAKTSEEIVPDGKMEWPDGNIILFKTLDLNMDFNGICEQLESIVTETFKSDNSIMQYCHGLYFWNSHGTVYVNLFTIDIFYLLMNGS